jgi:tetratricopeptide (TPR) repeat protein
MAFRKAFLFLFLVLSAGASSAWAQSPQTRDHAKAVADLKASLAKDPRSKPLRSALSAALSEWGNSLYESGNRKQALPKYLEAVESDPENGPAWFMLGDLSYLELSDFGKAEYYWNKAMPLAPPEIRRAIVDRISRGRADQALERRYQSLETPNFVVRYGEGFDPAEARRIGTYLEERYAVLAEELRTQASRLTVIIYADGSFGRLSGGHDEILGLYDGRIRMPASQVKGPYEKVILSHELAHAFLQHRFGGGLPVWIQEGYAQSKEPERPYNPAETEALQKLAEGTLWTPIPYLDRRFSKPVSADQASEAYLEARMAVRYLLENSPQGEFVVFLERLSRGEPVDKAFGASFPKLDWDQFSHGRGLGKIPD